MKTAASLVLLTLLSGTLSAEVTQIIAHRGASLERPECTLASIERAIEVKATAVEVDVRTSREPGGQELEAGSKELEAGSWKLESGGPDAYGFDTDAAWDDMSPMDRARPAN